MSYRSHYRGTHRVFDHLYDPIFKVSGQKDIWRANHMALSQSAPLHILPVYDTMFTDLPCRPRNYYTMQQNPLPHYPYGPHILPHQQKIPDVAGTDRAKYFNIPIGNKKMVRLKLDMPKDCHCIPLKESEDEFFKTKACQTVYRDSSAQTRPWMPDAIIGEPKRSKTPEVIYVADLIKSDALPGVHEVEIVERARLRWAWEATLPLPDSAREWRQRQLIIEAFEWEKWVAREDEIEDCQKLRYEIVQRLIEKRKNDMKLKSEIKLEASFQRLEANRQRKIDQLKNKHARIVRRLDLEHRKISRKYKPENISKEHSDPSSDLYAPQQRFGVHPKHRHFLAFKTQFEARLDNLQIKQPKPLNLQKYLTPKVDITLPKGQIKEVRPGLWTDKCLQNLYNSLKALGYKKPPTRDIPLCLEYIKESTESLATPSDNQAEEMYPENFDDAAVFKNLFQDAALKHLNAQGENKIETLLREVLAFNQEYNESGQTILQTFDGKRHERKRMKFMKQIKAQIDEILQKHHAGSMATLLEFLSEEIIRLNDEKKQHALILLAQKEHERQMAIELSRKEAEEKEQREKEELHRNQSCQNSLMATKYLENVLVECCEEIAESDARIKIREIVWRINDEIRNTTREQFVRGMLTDMILPSIFDKIEQHQQKTTNNDENQEEFNENIHKCRKCNAVAYIKQRIRYAIARGLPPDPDEIEMVSLDLIDNTIKSLFPEKELMDANEPVELDDVLNDLRDQLMEYAVDSDDSRDEEQ